MNRGVRRGGVRRAGRRRQRLRDGVERGRAGVPDFLTLKYGPGGNLVWERRFDGGRGAYDAGADVVLDPQGSVYVTGNSDGGSSWQDYLTIKYDPDGKVVWKARTPSVSMRPGTCT